MKGCSQLVSRSLNVTKCTVSNDFNYAMKNLSTLITVTYSIQSSSYRIRESEGPLTVTVLRNGDTTQPGSVRKFVDYV